MTAFGWISLGIAITAGLRAIWWMAWERVRKAARAWYDLRQEVFAREASDTRDEEFAVQADLVRWAARPWYVKLYEWGRWQI